MFKNNFAEIEGGAISSKSQGFIDEDRTTVLANNSAGYHSGDWASYATNITELENLADEF